MKHFVDLKFLSPAFVAESVFTMKEVTMNKHRLQEQRSPPLVWMEKIWRALTLSTCVSSKPRQGGEIEVWGT